MPEKNWPHKKFMELAISLARKGIGSVEPNPAVGAVLVKNGRIIGKGWHKKFGGPHAEINAISDCRKKGFNPAGSTMYVTLEPCCHFGKTPPCTDAIIKAGVKKVVVAVIDPSPHAKGKGIKLLRKAGVEVQTGLCKKQAEILNAPFFKNVTAGKPWIIIKWAQSRDGFLASKKTKWISNKKSRIDAHRLRRRIDAIIVGINTVIADDPLLIEVPKRKDRKITRVVLDSNLRIPLNCRIIKTTNKSPVLIITSKKTIKKNFEKASQIRQKGAEILTVPVKNGLCDINYLIKELSKRRFQQVLIEGGSAVINSFLKTGLADEIVVYIASSVIGPNGKAPIKIAVDESAHRLCLHLTEIKKFGDNCRLRYIRG